jgi:glucose-1-phosphate cytidylyltransferase
MVALEGISVQVVILAGGFGTRLAEETDVIPKPMVGIGGTPILVHIMNYYSSFGHTEFLIALGYKADVIRQYFSDNPRPDLSIELIDTGLETSTGGRVKFLEPLLDQEFMLTYGDGLSNVNINELVDYHKKLDRIATVTAVRPPARFGTIEISNGMVTKFAEKDPQDSGWINGGFFVCKKSLLNVIVDSNESLESTPMRTLVEKGQLASYQHNGWWQPMDTLRDKRTLESLWETGNPPWIR